MSNELQKVGNTKNYPTHLSYFCCDFYKETDETWKDCPNCGLRPKVWLFDNGKSTGCGCGNTNYDHFSIYAESTASTYKRKGDYIVNELRNNWNHWVDTGEILFKHASERDDGRY